MPSWPLHEIALTQAFLAQAKADGMTEVEITAAVLQIAENPAAGDPIVGSGGCRKVRVPGRGKGKSGGYRIITFYMSVDAPTYLLAVLSKGARENFSNAEVAAFKKFTDRLRASRRGRVVGHRR